MASYDDAATRDRQDAALKERREARLSGPSAEAVARGADDARREAERAAPAPPAPVPLPKAFAGSGGLLSRIARRLGR